MTPTHRTIRDRPRRRGYSALIRLFFGLCSTSAKWSTSSTGGTYIPNLPRRPFFSPYHPPTGFLEDRPHASMVPSAAGFCSSALPSNIQSPRLEHRVQVVDAPKVIAELRASRLDDERGWIERLVAKRQKLRRSARRLQMPWMFRRTVSSPARLPFASHFLPPKRSSSAVLDSSLEARSRTT